MPKRSELVRNEDRIRLNASIDARRFFLNNALPIRGGDESEFLFYYSSPSYGHDGSGKPLCKGLLLEALNLIGLQNTPLNNRFTPSGMHRMQKSVAFCFAEEVLKSISEDIGDDVFALLVDESCEVSIWKQIAVVLRYIGPRGFVKEIFVGFALIMEASVSELECAIYFLFAKLKLSLKQVRGQGYGGTCNMHDEFNGLKALVLRENSSAYYVHCFAQQLQLVVVAVAKNHLRCWELL